MESIVFLNIIGWGIIIYLYLNKKVTINEIKKANTPTKLMELQKKIEERGIEKFNFGIEYIEILVITNCSWCGGEGTLNINFTLSEGCPKCGGSRYRRGSGKQKDIARINQKGEIFKVVEGVPKKIDFKEKL